MRRARPKAYVLVFKKKALTVSPETYQAMTEWRRCYALRELEDARRLSIDRVVGNRKFALSPRAEVAAFRKLLRKLEGPAKARAMKQEREEQRKQEAYCQRLDARKEQEERRKVAEAKPFLAQHPLPEGIRAEDLAEPPYKKRHSDEALGKALHGPWSSGDDKFELWFVPRFGWVVPVLTIRDVPGYRSRHRLPQGSQRRTYAVALGDGSVCRVGFGPHVEKVFKIHLRKPSLRRLQPVISVICSGARRASECRDLLSSRRVASRREFGSLYLVPGGRR